MSENLAVSEPQLTLEFIRECLVGFTKSDGRSKQLCLEYLSPWLSNLDAIYGSDVAETDARIGEILNLILDITVKETEVRALYYYLPTVSYQLRLPDLPSFTA